MGDQDVQQGIALAKAGNKSDAARILIREIKKDPQNESAWLWLSTCVDSEDQRRDCLERVISINPNNQAALKALEIFTKPHPQIMEDIISDSKHPSEISSEPIAMRSTQSGIICPHCSSHQVLQRMDTVSNPGEAAAIAFLVTVVSGILIWFYRIFVAAGMGGFSYDVYGDSNGSMFLCFGLIFIVAFVIGIATTRKNQIYYVCSRCHYRW